MTVTGFVLPCMYIVYFILHSLEPYIKASLYIPVHRFVCPFYNTDSTERLLLDPTMSRESNPGLFVAPILFIDCLLQDPEWL